MKLGSKSGLAIMLLATMSVAQRTLTERKADSSGAMPAKAESSQASTARQPIAPATKAKVRGETRNLTDKDKRAYALGVEFGLDATREGMNLDRDLLIEGIKDGFTGGNLRMTVEEMNAILAAMQKEEREKLAVAVKALAEKNRKEEDAFLASNKTKNGVVTLPSGLQYKVLKEADGRKPGLDDKVVCNYRGTLLDGTEIDSSYKRNEASTFPLKGVLKGWAEALQLMPVGSKWQIFVPSDLAYGERGDGHSIGPNAMLIFEVELLSIQNSVADHAAPQGAKRQGSM